jgi:CRISPR-associated protein (TIGR03986 family)
MSPEKPYRIRVRVLDGKAREPNKLKGMLVPHVDVLDAGNKIEFIVCAVKEAHLDQVRPKLRGAGLEELPGGNTDVAPQAPTALNSEWRQRAEQWRRPGISHGAVPPNSSKLKPKPYGFVPLPDELKSAPPVWHDGTGTKGRLSGEIHLELETLTPLLVGWERRRIDDTEEPWPLPSTPAGDKVDVRLDGATMRTVVGKSVLCPLRAPWGDRPVLIPGDSIKGLLRNELGALLGAPMERVAERSYSYRPNSLFPKDPNPRLVARLARIADEDAVEIRPLYPSEPTSQLVRVPVRLELLPIDLKYDRNHTVANNRYRFDAAGGKNYRGGQGAGLKLNAKRSLHTTLEAVFEPTNTSEASAVTTQAVPEGVLDGYINTVRHLVDARHGHFSERHPEASTIGEAARLRILTAASTVVFQPDDMIWVEWDTHENCIVSLGWHYYYRWAYVDTIRRKHWSTERMGLFPLDEERALDEIGAPHGLSAVRRLFGYTGDNEGSKRIGDGDHTQLMGRVSVNAALEVVEPGDTAKLRFLPPTFLKELGMPRPSAVEHYLEQPYYPNRRPSDRASLVTFGDAAGYDEPGKLAGRKFYLDRKDAYTGEPWKDDSETNRLNERSTLAIEASRPGRRFRFTVRFQDLDAAELAAVLVALCPHQFRAILNGEHLDGYCSKLGYARPLGWGSMRIEAKALMMLDTSGDKPTLNQVDDMSHWVSENLYPMPMQNSWLAIHRRNHPDAGDYPRGADGNVYSYHTHLRGEHTRKRRYWHENT